ncbi:MAG: hypothetical protein K0R47_2246 [Brevibacillus sp.]|nr:hypothetical protein [Brevibacillus sp.]
MHPAPRCVDYHRDGRARQSTYSRGEVIQEGFGRYKGKSSGSGEDFGYGPDDAMEKASERIVACATIVVVAIATSMVHPATS